MSMGRWLVLCGAGAALCLAAVGVRARAEGRAAAPPAKIADEDAAVAAQGRVEPVSEEVEVSAEVSGRLLQVLVDEGDRVARGDVLAVVESRELDARVRDAQAASGRASRDAARARELFAEQVLPKQELDRAEADEASAQARADEARSAFDKSRVRAPFDGVVLRRWRRAGEVVSTQYASPIVTIGDVSRLRVRAEVDESDVGRVAVGAGAWVTAPAYGARRFSGRVVRIGRRLGRKAVLSDDPAQRVDSKVLEVLIALDDGRELPVGLRVDAFLPAGGTAKTPDAGLDR